MNAQQRAWKLTRLAERAQTVEAHRAAAQAHKDAIDALDAAGGSPGWVVKHAAARNVHEKFAKVVCPLCGSRCTLTPEGTFRRHGPPVRERPGDCPGEGLTLTAARELAFQRARVLR